LDIRTVSGANSFTRFALAVEIGLILCAIIGWLPYAMNKQGTI
jgi:hypothetical protein